MTTVPNRDICFYRSEAFAEDLLDDGDPALRSRQRNRGGREEPAASWAAGPGAALLCALPLGAAVVGAAILSVAASTWGWMV